MRVNQREKLGKERGSSALPPASCCRLPTGPRGVPRDRGRLRSAPGPRRPEHPCIAVAKRRCGGDAGTRCRVAHGPHGVARSRWDAGDTSARRSCAWVPPGRTIGTDEKVHLLQIRKEHAERADLALGSSMAQAGGRDELGTAPPSGSGRALDQVASGRRRVEFRASRGSCGASTRIGVASKRPVHAGGDTSRGLRAVTRTASCSLSKLSTS